VLETATLKRGNWNC